VCVKLVRHTAPQLLALGEPMKTCGLQAQERRAHPIPLREAQPHRLSLALPTAMRPPAHRRPHSHRLPSGKKLRPCQVGNAYAPTMAPMGTGKSHGPAQCGSTPGRASEPASGVLCAHLVPQGQPSAPSAVLPWLDKVQSAIARVHTGPKRRMHSGAGALGSNAPTRRQALPERGILTVGMPQTSAPLEVPPSAQDILGRRPAAGFNRLRTPHHVSVAWASGSRRPGVDSPSASLRSRGAGQVRDTGLAGAGVPQGLTGMAHHGAGLVRIRHKQRSKRAQKFRRLLGLKSPKVNEINHQRN
jgi:hypothetical protein